jgi:hypothetical protein
LSTRGSHRLVHFDQMSHFVDQAILSRDCVSTNLRFTLTPKRPERQPPWHHYVVVPKPYPFERIDCQLAMFWMIQQLIELLCDGQQFPISPQARKIERPLVILLFNEFAGSLDAEIYA